jgi:hypothetical protein
MYMKDRGQKARDLGDVLDQLEEKDIDPDDQRRIDLAAFNITKLSSDLRAKYSLTSTKRRGYRMTASDSNDVTASFSDETMDLYKQAADFRNWPDRNAHGVILMALCESFLKDPEAYLTHEQLAERTRYAVGTIATLACGFHTRCAAGYNVRSADGSYRLIKLAD